MPGKQDGPGPIIMGHHEKLVIIFFPGYTYVCSVMRACCPENFVHLGSM